MIEPRQLAALFAIAAGGILNAGLGAQIGAVAAPAPSPLFARSVADTTPAIDPVQQAASAALLAQVRSDLGDATATVELRSPLRFGRGSGRSLEGRGTAMARFDHGEPVLLEVSVIWDEPTQRVEQAAWLVTGPAPQVSLDAETTRRIADRIGSRLVLEFAGQPVDFALSRVEHLAAGRERLLVSGEGVADFGAEGMARTRFVATAEKSTGHLLTLQYELGEQVAQ